MSHRYGDTWRTLLPAQTYTVAQRLAEAAERAEELQKIVPGYAWEANAYRQALELIRTA